MDIITTSLQNFHENDIYIRDFYVNWLKEYLKSKQIIVVQWQRRVGKSYIILWLLKSLRVAKNKIFYLNKEYDERDQIRTSEDLTSLFHSFQKTNGKPEYIIIDEIQDIDNWENFIRARFAEKKYHIIITGSNSKLLSWELTTYLTGRYLNFYVYPFGYFERNGLLRYFLELWSVLHKDWIRTISRHAADLIPQLPKDYFIDYMQFGWLPETILIADNLKKNYLHTTLESFILKDIVARHGIKDVDLIKKVLSYIADTTWSILSIRNIADYVKTQGFPSVSVNTISAYLNYLTSAYIINKAPRYSLKWKKILEYKDKYFFTDIGIRNTLWYDFKSDRWKLLENIVFLHLKKCGYDVYVWEFWDKEIDFVAKKSGLIIYIQVAYLIDSNKVKDREFNNLLAINDNYPKYVISMDPIQKEVHEGINRWNIEIFLDKFI